MNENMSFKKIWPDDFLNLNGKKKEKETKTCDLPSAPLLSFLNKAAEKYRDNTALIFYGNKMSYGKLKESSDRFAFALQKLGIEKGDRIALFLPNCPQFVIAFYASLKIGAIISPLNPLYSSEELKDILVNSGAKTIISLDIFYNRIKKVKETLDLKNIILTDIAEYLPFPLSFLAKVKEASDHFKLFFEKEIHYFKKMLEESSGEFKTLEIKEEDYAVLMYTSGTTGTPKGVPLTHRNISANLEQLGIFIDKVVKEGKDIVFGGLPFFHIYGLTYVLNFSIRKSLCIVLMPKFHTKTVCEVIQKYAISIFPGVPAMYSAIFNFCQQSKQKYDFSSIGFWGSGASPCPPALIKDIKTLNNAIFIEAYGLTETSPVLHMNPPLGEQKPGSIGLALPNTECKIIDPLTKEELSKGEMGELVVRGPQVFSGYWYNQSATKEVLDKDGWFHTKDIAFQDNDGYFYIHGRSDDMINVRGEKVWPREIEEALEKYPGVIKAAVVGVGDAYYGQAPKAFVTVKNPDTTSSQLINFCKEKLAVYKVPKEIEIVDEIPKSHLGKVLRYVLRKQESDEKEIVEI